jgi:murE/murF fusion protein
MTKLIKVERIHNKFELYINVNGLFVSFYSKNKNKSNLYNILATLTLLNCYKDIQKLKKDIFLNLKVPSGRGDISKIKLKNKEVFLVDETYNSNPLSLKTAVENYDKIKIKDSKKYLILGDMLELGKHSIKQHKLISKFLNKTNIYKIYVIGKFILETFKGLKTTKKAKILNNKIDIIDLINKNLNNNDYLMIKGSHSTGLHKISRSLKKRSSYVI